MQTLQNTTSNTHNDSPCLRDEKRWELRSRMPRAILTTIHHVCAMRSLSAEYNFSRTIPTTIHHVCAMRRGGKVRRKEVQHVRLSLTPAVFSARHFSRRPSVRRLTARNIQKTARTRPQADSPATLQKIVPYDSRNLTLTRSARHPATATAVVSVVVVMPRHSRRRPRVRAASPSLDSIANGGLLRSACVGRRTP